MNEAKNVATFGALISWLVVLSRTICAMSSPQQPRGFTKFPLGVSPPGQGSPINIGFIGCGTIASAMVRGLATQKDIEISQISITRRSEKNSAALEKDFPGAVRVFDDVQDIVDSSDTVFLTLLPQHALGALEKLSFDSARHSLVSVVATCTLKDLADASQLPAKNVCKMICLPSVAKLSSVSIVVPKQDNESIILKMLKSLGGFVECETEQQMNAMMIPTAMMGPMYGLLRNNRDWLVEKGVSKSNASYFVAKQYMGMMADAVELCETPSRFDNLIEEQTPGGLNEQALRNLEAQNVFKSYDKAMDAVLSRLEGKSDGSL